MEFPNRDPEIATTDLQAFAHFIKSAIGSGILTMPIAFSHAGYIEGPIVLFLIAFLTAHCVIMLVKSAHVIYKRTDVYLMGYAELGEQVFKTGPEWAQKYSTFMKYLIFGSLFICYFTTCCCYTVIIANNFNYIIEHFHGEKLNIRLMIALQFIPLMALMLIPNLKKLSPVSMISDVFIISAILTTLYYICQGIPPISTRRAFGSIREFPIFYSVVLFGMGCIGPVMPLENTMKTPSHLGGWFGVISMGVLCNALCCLILGLIGYLRYGDECEGVIVLNLPEDSIVPIVVNLFVGVSLLGTFPLQLYVSMDILWLEIKDRYEHPLFANYIVRIILVTTSVGLSVAIPQIEPFVGLVGALTYSLLCYMFPALLELITNWEIGLGFLYWRVVKAAFIIICGFAALIFGCKSSITSIIEFYQT